MSGLRRFAMPGWMATLALTGVAGIVIRVLLYRSKLGIPDSDEGLVGLMVRHINEGQIPTFFWGQTYGGSQEALLTAPGFAIFGSSWVALRLVPTVLTALTAVVLWRVGRRLFGETAGAAAGALFWIWPTYDIYKLTHQWGFYASGVLYCGLLMLLALRIVERPDRLRVGLFGLVLGLAYWESSQIVPIAGVLIAWTAWRAPKSLRHVWIALPAFVLGALPWIVWNLRHDWGSFHFPITDTTTYQFRLRIFFSPILPMMLGLRAPFSQERLLPGPLGILTLAVYAGLFLLFLYGAYRSRRRNESMLYLIAAVFPFIYAIDPETLIEHDPGYIVIVTPVLALLFAQLATTRVRGLAMLAVALLVTSVTLLRMDAYHQGADAPTMAPRNIAPLVATLDRLGLNRVYSDYWLAYVLDFDTKERIVAAQNKFSKLTFANGQATPTDDPFNRYAPYENEVRSARRHGFIFFDDWTGMPRIAPQLVAHGYRRYLVQRFTIYALPPEQTAGG